MSLYVRSPRGSGVLNATPSSSTAALASLRDKVREGGGGRGGGAGGRGGGGGGGGVERERERERERESKLVMSSCRLTQCLKCL